MVYVPLCIQMIDQPGLKLLNIKVVHVPLYKQSPTGDSKTRILRGYFLEKLES